MTQGGKRPTKAERKEQARQQRLAEMKRRKRKAKMRKVWTFAAVAAVIAVVVVVVILAGKGNKKARADLDKLASAAGCTKIESPKDLGQKHVSPPEIVTYNSKPPTSGPHYGSPTSTGVHSSPIQNEVEVHNLEHSHIIVQYKPDIDQAFIDKLEDLAKIDDKRIIVAPYNDMDAKVAVTAWAQISTCSTTSDEFIPFARAFFDHYKGKGPEGDLPGTPA